MRIIDKFNSIGEKRKNFYDSIKNISLDCSGKEYNSKKFRKYIVDELEKLSKACSDYITTQKGTGDANLNKSKKSVSEPHLEKVKNYSNLLIKSIESINKLNLNSLNEFMICAKNLSFECFEIGRMRFLTHFGAVLDYKNTKEKFKQFGYDLCYFENEFNDLLLYESMTPLIDSITEDNTSLPHDLTLYVLNRRAQTVSFYYECKIRKNDKDGTPNRDNMKNLQNHLNDWCSNTASNCQKNYYAAICRYVRTQ